jgi:hypothetical protein
MAASASITASTTPLDDLIEIFGVCPKLSLAGKVAVILGDTISIGACTTHCSSRQGRVAIAGRRGERSMAQKRRVDRIGAQPTPTAVPCPTACAAWPRLLGL